jgi:hypothetical protein
MIQAKFGVGNHRDSQVTVPKSQKIEFLLQKLSIFGPKKTCIKEKSNFFLHFPLRPFIFHTKITKVDSTGVRDNIKC